MVFRENVSLSCALHFDFGSILLPFVALSHFNLEANLRVSIPAFIASTHIFTFPLCKVINFVVPICLCCKIGSALGSLRIENARILAQK